MDIPFTRKTLIDWAGEQVVHDAENLLKRDLVLEATYTPPVIRGAVLWNNRSLKTSLRLLPDGKVENRCPCYTNRERGMICTHVIALALDLVKRAADPLRDRKRFEEQRHAARIGAVDESRYIARAKPGDTDAPRATVRVILPSDWKEGCERDAIPVRCELTCRGRRLPLDQAPTNSAFSFDKFDETLLFVLEDIAEGPARGSLELSPFDFCNILRLHRGRALADENGNALPVHRQPVACRLIIDLDPESGMVSLAVRLEENPPRPDAARSLFILAGREGWAWRCNAFFPLQNVLPAPYHPVYDNDIRIPRENVLHFLERELPQLESITKVDARVSADMLTREPGVPRFRLDIKGSPASLAATLFARYNNMELVAGKPDARGHFALPDPNDPLRYTVRNPLAEKNALALLAPTGFAGETGDSLASIVEKRNVLNFLGSALPALRRQGWQVDLSGRVLPFLEQLDFVTPVVHIAEAPDHSWFDVGFDFEDGEGQSLSNAEIQLALRKGEAFAQRGNGRITLIDADAVESMNDVFRDCSAGEADRPGHFRLPGIYAPFVTSSLSALDGVDIEDTPAWRSRVDRCNRRTGIEPVALDARMEKTLRPYQKEGVYWLCFLDGNGFCGILADEMGLGKTLQTLAWLQHRQRETPQPRKPALIVCPTSLVDNWSEEAATFTPDLRTLILTGSDRADKLARMPDTDVAITSYAILRRDLDAYVAQSFSAVVLDEAQHIKNRSTQNAVAAKSLRAERKLVLTGTPVENSVSDLWSIMDFLMPGFLGGHDSFRRNYEQPIERAGPEADRAQAKLRRKLHPFMLRRLKTHVARDLPEKIRKVAFCSLSADQKKVYEEILKASRSKIANLVSARGFAGARMEILATLLRLRQICCHLDLLKLPDLNARYPSAKMELFFELLDEAIDGSHRILVFSQFVSMLQILKRELDERGIRHSYLDGATRDRMDQVRAFNADRKIPLFLISLKAGGVGLNLTGADTVIHYDPWWNPAVEEQATDRAHRIGQKRTVYSLKLIARNTVEEKVLALQKRKQAVIDATLGTDAAVMEKLSWEDIQNILSM
jgi:superfamily II DNA or RNA helicase